MLGYLSKFVLQMLPTISATVIGAYIVTTWINPRTPPDAAKVTAQAAKASQTAKASQADKASQTSEPEVLAVPAEVRSTDATEPAKPVKAANGPDNIRIIPIVKERSAAADAAVSAPAPMASVETASAVDEKKDANELARAAIQRLRGGTDTARAVEEPAKPAPSPVRVQQARATPEPQPLPAATAVPPLPPAVSISTPKYPQGDVVEQVASDRLTPPAEIPGRSPLSLHASHRVAENPSLADDFLSATKSFFRAITP